MRFFSSLTLETMLRASLTLFLFVLPWQTLWIIEERIIGGAKWEYGTIGWYATEALLWWGIILFMMYTVKALRREGWNALRGVRVSLDRVAVLFCLIAILYTFASSLWAEDSAIALQHARRILAACLLFFALFLGPLSPQMALRSFLAGAVGQALFAIGQFATQSIIGSSWLGVSAQTAWTGGTPVVAESGGRWLRASAGFPHPNVLGGYLALAFTCLAAWFLSEKEKTKRYAVFMSAELILVAGLFFSFSRSAWMACGFTMVGFGLWVRVGWKHILRFFLPLAALASLFVILFFPLLVSRVAPVSSLEARSIDERLSGLAAARSVVMQHPITGVGIANYTAALQTLSPGLPGFAYQPVHNSAILVLAELGFVGAMLWLGTLGTLLWSLMTFKREGERAVRGERGMWYVIMLLPYLAISVFDHYLVSSYVGLMLSAVYFALVFRLCPHSLHTSSTE